DRGDFRLFLAGAGGPSGARLLGRFCHADPALSAGVAEHLRAEEARRPDAAFAEVVHLPEGRLGNILTRPADRGYEIPYLGRPVAPPDRQLPLSDLRVSVAGGRVVLRSARLRREVAPRLTNAHNYVAGAAVYRFLCALQDQGVASGLGWDWGPLAASAYLPRVVHGRLILSRARWRVTSAEASRLLAADGEDRFTAVRHWRAERRLPRWVCVAQSDNELPIDLDNRLMVQTLLGLLRADAETTLIELFPAPDRLCAFGQDGRYMHELVVPFVARGNPPAGCGGPWLAPRRGPLLSHPRAFPPGSEWLTVKLYAGPLGVDHLVRDVVGPVAVETVAGGLARRWFFVRYADPHSHLRLRFEGDPRRLWDDVLPRVRAGLTPLLADGRVWKVQLDTYEPEVERYGGPAGIAECEEIFHHDSRAVVELLRLPGDDPRGDQRWRLALLGMDRLLGDLRLDLPARRAVLRRARDAMRAEFGTGGGEAGRLGARYRAESAAIAELLDPDGKAGPEWSEARAVLELRSRATSSVVARLRPTVPVADLAPSLLHMHANRLLRSAHLAQEAVLYDFLSRYYDGQLARRSVVSRIQQQDSDPHALGTPTADWRR
ncbi:MAG TPA: thiopeptide-type bacteriocin biosynthesis protein, partial [Gemmataceae bacterium]